MGHPPFGYYLRHLGQDAPAGLVVFLVALPLCLGIALASGAPLFAGVVSGIVGGLVVAWLSGSQLSVSGPAAGLTVIVLNAIDTLGGFQSFLFAVMVAGAIQLLLGFLRAGLIGAYFPSAVIKGMLAAIGLILIMKQIPHAVGFDADFEGDEAYMPADAGSTVEEIFKSFGAVSLGPIIVSAVSVALLLAWESAFVKRHKLLSMMPGPLLAVLWGVGFNVLTQDSAALAIHPEHLVSLPAIGGVEDFLRQLVSPDFSQYANPKIYSTALTLAVVASLESLLSLEATDKLDPLKRVASTNRELKAQGVGNLICGLLGGLPMTAVIVRSSANINAGGRTKMAGFVHGLLLLLSVMFLSQYLNLIPLACLASILLLTGYKLAKPRLFIEMHQKGINQLAPFVITVAAILVSDLLKGMAIGMVCGLFFVLKANYHAAITLTQDGSHYLLRLHKDVSFLNKALLRTYLGQVADRSHLLIDGSKAQFIDQDILETLQDFLNAAKDRGITVDLKKVGPMNHAGETPV
jgi:MFS superfamily sulfate permease-like transporter